MCDLDDDGCPVSDQRWPRARKPHTCMACRETVSPGHKYHLLDFLFDGRWDHWKHCLRCWAIFEAIHNANRALGEPPVAVDLHLDCGESWRDIFGDMPPEVEALAFALPGEAV